MKIAIAGASGRMGRMLIETVLDDPEATLAGALDRPGTPQLGEDAGAFLGKSTGVVLTDDIERVFAGTDLLIDFTRPEGTLTHLEAGEAARREDGDRHDRFRRCPESAVARPQARRSASCSRRT